MATVYYHTIFAQAYGGGTYDNSMYGQATTNTGKGNTASGSGLTSTGIAIASIMTLAAVVLLITLVVRIWRRPGKQVATVEVVESAPADIEAAQEDPYLEVNR